MKYHYLFRYGIIRKGHHYWIDFKTGKMGIMGLNYMLLNEYGYHIEFNKRMVDINKPIIILVHEKMTIEIHPPFCGGN